MRRILVALVAGLASTTFVPLAEANHPQTEYGSRLAFVHRGGNEWWVEVAIIGYPSRDVVRVQARDDDSSWTDLTLRSWGNWAGSFHIEPDNRVRFRATVLGEQTYSCQFTHPAGAEQCRYATSKDPYAPVENVLFDHLGGHPNSVSVLVQAINLGPASQTYARLEGSGDWQSLQQTAASPDGSTTWKGLLANPTSQRIEFMAYQAGGMSDVWRATSCPFLHDGREICGGGMGWGLMASYTEVKGNEWWIQAKVTASKPIAGVDVRIDHGAEPNDDSGWIALENKGWGWAKSTHVIWGELINFRTRATDGSVHLSDGGWQWPSATPYPQWPSSSFDVEFRNLKGNEWWVQVDTMSDKPIFTMLAYEKDSWATPDYQASAEVMFQQDWGDWAKSIHVERGHLVKFWVHTAQGESAESGWMEWPPQ